MANKSYIGKGKQGQYSNIRVTVNMDKAQEFVYEYEGNKYLTFTVAEMQRADDFGKTHTAYVLEKEEVDPNDTMIDRDELQGKAKSEVEPGGEPVKTKKKKQNS